MYKLNTVSQSNTFSNKAIIAQVCRQLDILTKNTSEKFSDKICFSLICLHLQNCTKMHM